MVGEWQRGRVGQEYCEREEQLRPAGWRYRAGDINRLSLMVIRTVLCQSRDPGRTDLPFFSCSRRRQRTSRRRAGR